MAEVKIGTVEHFYDKIMVAAIVLSQDLKVGDKVKFVRGGEDLFEETVESMQKEHRAVEIASAGDSVGIRVGQKVKAGAEVYKLEG